MKNLVSTVVLALFCVSETGHAETGVAPTDRQSAPLELNEQLGSDQASSKASSDERDALILTLNSIDMGTASIDELINQVLASKYLTEQGDELISRIEGVLLAYTKPLPGSNIEGNLAGYSGLAFLRPEIATYSEKRDAYESRRLEKRASIVATLRREDDAFNGITWYKHPSYPKYTDTRNFIQPYIGKDGNFAWLRIRMNYTSRRWLFIESAKANIDGSIVDMNYGEFLRDNDSEIWEWIDVVVTPQIRETLERIAGSKSTIIRFDGQQYYDDFTVTEKDKQAIRDMILAVDVLNGP